MTLDRRPFLLLALAGSLAASLAACGQQSTPPDGPIALLDGPATSLGALRGKPVLLTFWATTCPGCIEEIPHLNDLHGRYGPRGLRVIGVAMSYDQEQQVRALRERKGIAYPIAHDRDGQLSEAMGKVRLTPTSFLIDPQGQVVYQKIGAFDLGKVSSLIEGMLPKG
ncbi:MAG: TlpA family protein disulfide reductase [Halothiobacillaceae bacterium]|jgi:peroxiredoxin|nr:MAG: TlpA family protein disulfide reductase [Halothiobacillaceae bacterium]